MKQAAILCGSGIGDGLLMMVAAHHLKKKGYAPTIFHHHHKELAPLFEGYTFAPHPANLEETLKAFDRVIVENDNSKAAWELFDLRDVKKLTNLTFFFPTPCRRMVEGDFLFDPKKPIASNLSAACQKTLKTDNSKENDLSIPKEKTFRKHPKRIVIHPTSNDPKRNWEKEQFLALAARLENKGYTVSFCVGPNEKKGWEGVDLPSFKNLQEVAAYIYESGFLIGNDSGIGHLASNLGIPTLTISGNPKRVRLWRPDWAIGKVVTLPFPLPNFKGINMRVRENHWQRFISVGKVFKTFQELVDESSRHLL